MTIEDKREILRKLCIGKDCSECELRQFNFCENAAPIYSNFNSDEFIEKAYSALMKSKGETTMNKNTLNVTKTEEKTITISVSEYRFLISEQSTLSKLEGYAETHEYLNDEVVRALLGVEKPAANLESEGD